MSSVRNLKKAIDDQLLEVISDTFLFAGLHPEKSTEEVNDIVEDAVKLRNDLIARVNSFKKGEEGSNSKAYFAAIKSDLLKGSGELCERLSAVSKKKK